MTTVGVIEPPLILHAGAGVPLMAAGGTSGAVTVWNLEEKRLHTIVRCGSRLSDTIRTWKA